VKLPADLLRAGELLAEAGVALSVGDAERRGFPLVHVNTAFADLTGYPVGEVLGRKCSFLQDPDTDPADVQALSTALHAGRPVKVTLRNVRRDGAPFFNELRLLAPDGPPGGRYVVAIQNDVTRTTQDVDRLRDLVAVQDRELGQLRALQAALTPPAVTEQAHLDVASAFVPAEAGVAGDFFLVTTGPAETVTIAVGDVVGHGLEAARRASFVRTSLAAFAGFTDDPQRLLELANHSLVERAGAGAEFVTAVVATFRPGGSVRIALAGHPRPRRLDEAVEVQDGRAGLPLGIGLDLGGEPADVVLPRGSGLLFYTDGLPEARRGDGGGIRFGDERVDHALRTVAGADARATVDALAGAVDGFVCGHPADDLCLVAVRAVT
jgi:sigma-B regulation protein RsbU (phosphoserine phosphatase)